MDFEKVYEVSVQRWAVYCANNEEYWGKAAGGGKWLLPRQQTVCQDKQRN